MGEGGGGGGASVAKMRRREREAWIQRDRQHFAGEERTPVSWRGSTPGSIAVGSTFSTTGSTIGSEGGGGGAGDSRAREKRRRAIRTDLSLTAFQAKYTSEDNESFNTLLDKQTEKKAAKYSWLTDGNKILSKRQIAYRARQDRLLEEGNLQARRQEVDSGTDEGGNTSEKARAVVVHSSSNSSGNIGRNMAGMEDTRPAMPDIRPPPPRNSLMFLPDSVEDKHETVAQAAEAASKAGPKTVVYPNTRMPSATTTSRRPPYFAAWSVRGVDADHLANAEVPQSPTLSAVRDAVAGHPRLSASETESVCGYNNGNIKGGGNEVDDVDTPHVNGYAFVDEEPEPGEQERLHEQRRRQERVLQEQRDLQRLRERQSHKEPSLQHSFTNMDTDTDLLAPLTQRRQHDGINMDDGNSSFPSQTGRSSKSANPFTIRQSSRREALHHALVARTAAKKRAAAASVYGGNAGQSGQSNSSNNGIGRTPTPRFASGPAISKGKSTGNLTPAGAKLLRSIGTPRAG